MTSKLVSLFFGLTVALIALTGCERAQKVVMDSMPPEDDTTMEDSMIEATPMKIVC